MSSPNVRIVVTSCLIEFLDSTNRPTGGFDENTNLIKGLGLKSDEGLDFVLDLCQKLNVDFPHDYNPFVHGSGRRGAKVGEMIRQVEILYAQMGAAA